MKYVYSFDELKDKNASDLLGVRGNYISKMTDLRLPIKNGFVITTDACNQFYEENRKINYENSEQINEYVSKLEELTDKKFGDIDKPLLLSIKCSPKIYVPNTMFSVSNVGLTSAIVEKLSKTTDEFRWIWECYIDFIKDYSKFVMGIDLETYEYIIGILHNKPNISIEELRELCNKLKKEYKLKTETEFPDNHQEQLELVLESAFKCWDNKSANIYRRDMDIPFKNGMAILVQQTALGNINKTSGIGTIYTRDPITGETKDKYTNKKYFVGNFSKQSTQLTLNENKNFIDEDSNFAIEFEGIYNQLMNISKTLEKYYKDMLKIDFVIENNQLFITEVCKGKRSVQASLKIACDIFDEYTLNKKNNKLQVNKNMFKFNSDFGGFKQKQYEELDSTVQKMKKLRKF